MAAIKSVTKPVAVLVSVMMLASLMALGPGAVASPVAANPVPDELGRADRPVATAFRCLGDGGSFGPLDIPFDVPVVVNSPTSVQPGKTFLTDVKADPVDVPATFDGLPVTINNFTGLQLRAYVAPGVEVVSVSSPLNSGYYQPGGNTNPNAPKTFLNPGTNGITLTWNEAAREVRMTLPGPYNGNSRVQPPTIRVNARATGDSGTLASSQFAGSVPTALSTFPWPSYSFTVTVSASVAGVTTITAPAYCAPNYGRGSNIPGNDKLPIPYLQSTWIDGDGPQLNVRKPRNGFTYDVYDPEKNPDSTQLIADFDCSDVSGVVSCEMVDANNNVIRDGDRLPDTSNNTGRLTLRATDNFGFVSEQVIDYEVSSNSAPQVDAGADQNQATNKRVVLGGGASDVDFGQLLSYRWIQVSGPAVQLENSDDPFETDTAFITPSGPETLVFKLRVDDGQTYGEDTVTVTVDPNIAPQIRNGQFQRLGYEDNGTPPIPTRSTVTMDATADDPDGQPVTYNWRQVDEFGATLPADHPDRVQLSSSTAPVVTFTAPNQSREFRLYFAVDVSDGDPRATVEAKVDVKIRRNLEPVFGGGNEQLITDVSNGAPVRIIASALDPEGRTVSYAWRQVDENGFTIPEGDPRRVLPDSYLAGNNSPILDFTTSRVPDASTLYFRVVASDGLDLGDTEAAIEVRVLGNQPPGITNGPEQELNVLNRSQVTLDGSATDPEGFGLSYVWTQVNANGDELAVDDPSRVTLSATDQAVVTFNSPDTSDSTTLYFKVSVSDGVSNGVTVGDVEVNIGPNLPPTLPGGLIQTLAEVENRGSASIDGTASDPEGRPVTYAWRQVDAQGADIDVNDPLRVSLSSTTTPTVNFTGPNVSQAATLYFRAVVSDGLAGGSAEAAFTITFRGNNPPVISAPAQQNGVSGLSLTLDGSASDLDIINGDNQTLSWAWVQVDANGDPLGVNDPSRVTLSNANIANPSFTPPIANAAYSLYFRLTVTDGNDPVTLLVTSTFTANTPPVANAGPAQTKRRGVSTTLAGSGTDPDGHSIGAYSWQQVDQNGNALASSDPYFVTLSNATVTNPTFTTPNVSAVAATLYFALVVSDQYGQASTPDVVEISVTNGAPTANAGVDQTGRAANSSVSISGSATDPDVPLAVTYLWEQVDVNGDLVANPGTNDLTDTYLEIASPTSAATTFVAPQTSSSRTYYLRLTVTDDGGLTASDVMAVQVNPVALATPSASPGTTAVAGTYIQFDLARPGSPSNPSDNFSYNWFQTNTGSTTTACAPSCTGGNAVIHTSGTYGSFTATPRQPVIEMPGRTDRNPANSFFKVEVADTFGGANLLSATVTLTTTNSDPTVEWSIRGYGSTATAQPWTSSTPNNPVWSAAAAASDNNGTILLDATKNPAVTALTTDVDSDTLTYSWTQWNNDATVTTNYQTKTNARVVVTSNYAIPGGRRNCSNIDLGGVSNLANGDRVLLVGQTNAAQNGLWVVPNRSGTGLFGSCSNNGGTWARATDADAAGEIAFMRVPITAGTGAGKVYVNRQVASSITVGTTAMTFIDLIPSSQLSFSEGTPIYTVLAGTGGTTDAQGLRSTAAGSNTNTVTNSTGLAYLNVPANIQVPLQLTVTDGLATLQTFRMVVRTSQTANSAPAATRTSAATQTIRGGVSTTLSPVTLGATLDDTEARTGGVWPVNGSSANENLSPQSLSYKWIQTNSSGTELAANDPDRVVIANSSETVLGTVSGATAVNTTFTPPSETKTVYFRLRATDGIKTSLSDIQTVVFEINRLVPAANAGADQDNVRAGQGVTLDGSGSTDSDGSIASYLWQQVDSNGALVTSGPTQVTLSNTAAVAPTFTAPSLVGNTDLYFRLTTTDDFGDTGTDTVRIGVLDDGSPTAVGSFSPDPVALGQTLTLSGQGSSDPEGQNLAYSWVQEDANGNALASSNVDYQTLTGANAQSATFTVPARPFATTLYFRLTVSDTAATPQTGSSLVTVAVPANLAPTAVAASVPASPVAGETVTLSSQGTSDPEGNSLTYSWVQVDENGNAVTSGPTFVTLSSATAASPTFRAPGLQTASTLRFVLTVTDTYGANDVADTVVIEVPANQLPTLAPTASPNPANPGDTITLSANAVDPEGVSPMTYRWVQVDLANGSVPMDPSNADYISLTNATSAQPSFVAPVRLASSTFMWDVFATDEFGSESTLAVVVVVNANRAPTAEATATPNPAPPGALVTLSSGGVDLDGDTVTNAWVQVDANGNPLAGNDPDLVTLSSTTDASPTFNAPDRLEASTLYFRVTVADRFGVTGTSTVTVSIVPNARPLVAAAALPPSVKAGGTISLISAATDPEGRPMTFQWMQTDLGGNAVTGGPVITDATSANASVVAPGTDQSQVLLYKFSATDDTGVPSSTIVSVLVLPNESPTALPTASALTAPPGGTVTLSGEGSTDPEGDPIASYSWTQTSGPAVTLSDATAASPTFVAPATNGATVQFGLVVTDRWGEASRLATVSVVLQANNTPVANAGTDQSNIPPAKTVTLDGSATDADGHSMTYAWTQQSGPSVTLSDATILNPTFVPTVAGTYLFQLVATDQFGFASSPKLMSVVVNPNRNPVPNAGADQSDVVVNTTATLNGSATDPDITDGAAQTLTYLWEQTGGAAVTLSSTTDLSATFSVPVSASAQTLTFRLTATDNFGGTASDTVVVNVLANRAPVVNAGDDQSNVGVAKPVTLTGSATDADITAGANQSLTYSWTQVSGEPVVLSGDTTTTATFESPSTISGTTLVFRLTTDDGQPGGIGTDEVSIVVNPNVTPVATAGNDQADVVASTTVTLSGSATDGDIEAGANQSLTYSWTQTSGDPVTLNGASSTTKTFEAPATANDQTLTFLLSANDGTNTGTDEVSIFVKANRVPVVNAGSDQLNVVAATTVRLSATASDADIDAGGNQTLTTGWIQLDPATNFTTAINPNDALVPLFTVSRDVEFVAPSTASAQELRFAYFADDAIGVEQSDVVSVFVAANRVPVVNAGDDQNPVAASQVVTLSGSATDPDIEAGAAQTISGYTWTQVSGDTVNLIGAEATTKTFQAPSTASDQTLVFRLSATDGTGVGSDDVSIFVKANVAPTVNAGSDQAHEANTTVTLTGTKSDPDPQTLTVTWSQISGETVSGLTATNQDAISFITPINNTPQTLVFRYSVTDGTTTSTDEVSVFLNANRAPVANAGSNRTGVSSGSLVTLDGTGSTDPEGLALTYSWSQVAGTSVTLTGATTATPSFTTPLTAVGLSLGFRLTVTDPQGKTATSNVSVVVLANRPPAANAGADQIVPRQRLVTLDGTGSSDPDGQVLTYNWVQVTGIGSMDVVPSTDPFFAVLSSVAVAQPTFTSPLPQNDGDAIYFMLVVLDPTGLASPASWTKVTLGRNKPPVADAGQAQTGIAHNATVTLNGSATDPDADETFTYQWTQVDTNNNPVTPTPGNRDLGVVLSDPTSATPTFTAPYLDVTTTLRFRLVVTDTEGATDDATTTVEVLANRAPVVNPGADQTNKAANSAVTLTGSATDPDLDEVTYEWTQVDGNGTPVVPTTSITDEAVELSVTTGTTTTFTTPIINASTTLRFRLRVTDSEGAVTDAVTTVQVNANRAPTATYSASFQTKTNVVVVSTDNVSLSNRACSDVNIGGVNNLANGARVLLTAQANPAQNGIWVVPNRPGTGLFGGCNGSNAWNRATDADTAGEINYARVVVTSGTGAGSTWVLPQTGVTLNTTALGFVLFTSGELPVNVSPAASARVKGATVTLSYALPLAANADPDGTSADLFTYEIARVANPSATTPCGNACGGLAATVTTTPATGGLQATFVVPGVTSNDPMYFRMFINDGYGATYVSPAVTVTFQNTQATIGTASRNLIKVYAGADVRIDENGVIQGGTTDPRAVMGGPGQSPVTPGNVFNDGRPGSAGNFFPQSTYVYGGIPVLLDARDLAAAADPDGGATVDFAAGLPPVATGINLSGGLNVVTGNPNGVCQAGFVLSRTTTPNVWAFTPPTGVNETAGFCRIQFKVNDSLGGSTTWGVPTGCLTSGTQTLVSLGETLGLIPAGSLPACTSPAVGFHAGDRGQGDSQRVSNVSNNVNSDFWLRIWQNKAIPLADVEEIPAKTFSSTPGQAPTTVTLDGSGTIDADGSDNLTPRQPLLYNWTALDPETLELLADDADANQRIADRSALVTQFSLPDGGPVTYRFQLDVYDGLTRDIIETDRMRVTVRRPVANGTATVTVAPAALANGAPTYPTAVPNDDLGEVADGDSVTLSAAGSSSPDGRTLKYLWRILEGGADAEILDARSANATLLVGEPAEGESETLVVELAVRDGFSAAYKTFTFTNVAEEEPPPPPVFCPAPVDPYPYSDIPVNNTTAPYRAAVACLAEKNIFTKTARPAPPGPFNPTGLFLRFQVLLTLFRDAGSPLVNRQGQPYTTASVTDVTSNPNDPSRGEVRKAVNWAYAEGVASNNRTFRPEAAITRAEVLAFLQRYTGYKVYNGVNNKPLASSTSFAPTDSRTPRVAAWQQDVVAWAYERGIGEGNAFRPTANMVRSDMARLLWRWGHVYRQWVIDPANTPPAQVPPPPI